DALLVELQQWDRVHHQVAVVGNELERHGATGGARNGELPEPRHRRGQNSEAVLSRQHLHVWSVGEVDQRDVADHAVRSKDVEKELTLGIERSIRYNQVDVEIEVARVQLAAAG